MCVYLTYVNLYNKVLVEINENHLSESTSPFLRTCWSKGVRYHHLHLAENQRQAREWESLIVRKKEVFRHFLTGGCWLGTAGGRLTRSRVPYGTGLETIFGFLCLVLIWKLGTKTGRLAVVDQILTPSGPVITEAVISIPGLLAIEFVVWFSGMVAAEVAVWLLELMWVWPLSTDIFSLSS